MWLYVTESPREAERVLDRCSPRPSAGRSSRSAPSTSRSASAEQCAERLDAYAQAGAQRIFVWPLADELRQLELLRERVAPLVGAAA